MRIRFIFNDAETPDENRNRLLGLLNYSNLGDDFLKEIEGIISFYDTNSDLYANMERLKVGSSDDYLKKLKTYAGAISHIIDSINEEDADLEPTRGVSDKEFVNSKYVRTIMSKLNNILLKASEQLKDPDIKNNVDTKLVSSKFEGVINFISKIKTLDNTNYKEFNKTFKLGDTLKDTQQFIRAELRKFESYSKNYENAPEIEKNLYYKYLESLKAEYDNFVERIKILGQAKNIDLILNKILQFNSLWEPDKTQELISLMKKSGDHNAHPNNVYVGALKYINKLYSKIPEAIKEDASMRTKISKIENIIDGFESTIKNKTDMKNLNKDIAGALQSGLDQAGKLVGKGVKTSVDLAKKTLTSKVGIDK